MINSNKKIFCIGSHKTGTTSIDKIFTLLNLNSAPWKECYDYIHHLESGELNNFMNIINKYNAFQDSPWCHANFYKIIYSKFPDSYYILTERDSDSWIKSYENHHTNNLLNNFDTKTVQPECWSYLWGLQFPYSPEEFAKLKSELVQKYEKRNKEIKEFFKYKKNFISIDLTKEKDISKISTFLGLKNNFKVPHENKGKY